MYQFKSGWGCYSSLVFWLGMAYSYDRRLDLVGLVRDYLKRSPSHRSLRVLSEEDWALEVPEDEGDRLTGGIAAITTPDGDIIIRSGFEDSAVHELVHASGFMPQGISRFLNEGLTQLVAEDICSKAGIQVRSTYRDEVRFVGKYIIPLTGVPLRAFAQEYAKASHKAELILDYIWRRYADKFEDIDDWGSNPRGNFLKDLQHNLGSSPYLAYLVDELRVV